MPRPNAARRTGSGRTAGGCATTTPTASAGASRRSRPSAPRSPLPRRGRAAAARRAGADARADAGRVRAVYLERHAAGVRPRTIRPCASGSAYARAAFGDVPLRDLERMSGEIAALAGTLPDAPGTGSCRRSGRRSSAAVRWGYMSAQPGEARRAATASRRRAPVRALHRRRGRGDRGRAVADVPAAAGVRRRDRAAARGVAGARAPRRRPPRRRAQRAPHGLERRGGGAGQDDPQPPPGAAVAARARRARRAAAAARHAAAVPGPRRRAAQPRQLPPPRMGAGDRGGRASRDPARIYDLRSTFASNALAAGVDVFELARVMGTSVADDRAPLRGAARRRRRRDRAAAGRVRGRAGASTGEARSED